ncbi:MAG: hypothetical protein RR058_05945 [Oscillospiraceae bacterium]
MAAKIFIDRLKERISCALIDGAYVDRLAAAGAITKAEAEEIKREAVVGA